MRARQLLVIRTGTMHDQTVRLEAPVSACTLCNVVSLSTTDVNFNTPPL